MRCVTALAAVSVAAVSCAGVAQAHPRPAELHAKARVHHATHARHRTVRRARAAVAAATLYVKTTGSDTNVNGTENTCRISTKPCLTIGHAVSVAQSGDTISVGKGSFPEQLDLSKNLTIKGVGDTNSGTIIDPTSVTTSPDGDDSSTNLASIVTFEPGVTFGKLVGLQVNASGVASGSSLNSCTDAVVGVYYHDASGKLTSDKVTGTELGPDYFGCQPGGLGVYVTNDNTATPSDVTMTTLIVNQYAKNGITCNDPGTDCTITGSTVSGLGPIPTSSTDYKNQAQNGIQVFGADASITSTTISGNSYTSPQYNAANNYTYYTASGILAINAGNLSVSKSTLKSNDASIYALWYPAYGSVPSGGQGAWSITNNKISAATNDTGVSGGSKVPAGDGFGDGIDLDGTGTGGSTTVTGNSVTTGAEYGIALFDATGATVTGNTTTSNKADGIYVGDLPFTSTGGIAANTGASTGNNVSNNKSNSNKLDGIRADVTSVDSGNTFSGNTLSNDVRYDAEDLSTGTGTAGTDNIWTGSKCTPTGDGSPEGICTS